MFSQGHRSASAGLLEGSQLKRALRVQLGGSGSEDKSDSTLVFWRTLWALAMLSLHLKVFVCGGVYSLW